VSGEADEKLRGHLFAWDGVSLLIPDTWNLAGYSFSKGLTHVEFEDDCTLRMEAEWIRPPRRLDIGKIQKRYGKAAKKLTRAALKSYQCEDAPAGWSAFVYELPGGERLLTAFFLTPDFSLFNFVRIRFGPQDTEDEEDVLKLVAASFRTHQEGEVPWALYDISIALPSDFRLLSTSIQAGRKLLVFQWRLRRFFLWHFSLADILLKQQKLEEWAAEFLNSFKGIKGPTFAAGHDGEIIGRRKWGHRLGHFEEIGRLCFRYCAKAIHDSEKNRVVLWVFNYRKAQDLEKIPRNLR
jgi:hypothetical protein